MGGIGIHRPDATPRVKYAQRERDTPQMMWVKTQRCCAHRLAELAGAAVRAIIGPCRGVVEADHAGANHGMQRKSGDDACIPLCVRHHRDPGLRHMVYGKLRKGLLREFFNWMVDVYQELYAALVVPHVPEEP